MLKDNLEKFSELPIYIDHQRTAEDLIGMATKPELIKMDNGKTAVKMLATVSNQIWPRSRSDGQSQGRGHDSRQY